MVHGGDGNLMQKASRIVLIIVACTGAGVGAEYQTSVFMTYVLKRNITVQSMDRYCRY